MNKEQLIKLEQKRFDRIISTIESVPDLECLWFVEDNKVFLDDHQNIDAAHDLLKYIRSKLGNWKVIGYYYSLGRLVVSYAFERTNTIILIGYRDVDDTLLRLSSGKCRLETSDRKETYVVYEA